MAKQHPDHAKLDALLWNAADCLRAADELPRAREAAQRLLSARPDSDYAAQARDLLGE